MKSYTIKEALSLSTFSEDLVNVKGWVKTKRTGKSVFFVAINDGSCFNNLQLVGENVLYSDEIIKSINTGASLSAVGILKQSQGKGQTVEMEVKSLEILGEADPEIYPLQKKGHSLEFLRDVAHLRFRTNTHGSIFRIRHHASFAIHKFFNDNGFYYLHTPIITGADAEGAGETFKVTTLDLYKVKKNDLGAVDFESDFFGKATNLTVSGQLEAELGALALGKVYTFGPTFRAENSNTPRHLAEFWMIEPEAAFFTLEDDMKLATDFLKYVIGYIVDFCPDELKFLQEQYDAHLLERLNFVVQNDFEKVTYTDAIELLINSKQKFEFPVKWGLDLQSEHERYLVEKIFNKPVILYNYPKEIKAFYMRQNDDGKTVAAMDILFPGVGEIIGGSQREERLPLLEQRIAEVGIDKDTLWWYLDIRRFGGVPHAGFGLGLERLLMFVTGMSNIRDVIPFPRTPRNADF